MDVSVVVLAGGLGKRLGRPKARIRLEGKPLYVYALDAPAEIIVVTSKSVRLPRIPPRAKVVIDPGEGPAYAVKEALKYASGERIVIRPIDMPLLSRDIIRKHLFRGIVVFGSRGRIHWTASIWPRRELVVNSRRMRDLFAGKEYEVVRLDECSGININTLDNLIFSLKCLEKRH